MKIKYFIFCLLGTVGWAQEDCTLPSVSAATFTFDATFEAIAGNYIAQDSIVSTDEIASTNYLAPEIILNDGFKATAGSEVLLTIKGCEFIDLYIKDNADDNGSEPNNASVSWDSPDIWIRNSNDNGTAHQSPIFGQTNYIYVKVRNKSTVSISPNSPILAKVNVSIASPSANQDQAAALRSFNPIANDNYRFVGEQTITSINALGSTILVFEFIPPMPWVPAGGYRVNLNILARIECSQDPLRFPLTNVMNRDVVRNNNLATKNNIGIGMVSEFDGHFLERIQINNPNNEIGVYRLELKKEDLELGKPIYDEAEVGLEMDPILFSAWERGGKIKAATRETTDEKKKIANNNQVLLDNIILNPFETGNLTVSFTFLADELTDKTNFVYHLLQKDAITDEIVGAQSFHISKNNIEAFEATAPDKEIDKFETITLTAEDIGEPALYNWYDSEGNLVYQGKELQIANAVAEKYKLEVISSVDGLKDYSDVEVSLKRNRVESIYPNPASNQVNLKYKINHGNSAYIIITSYYMTNGISNNYMVNVNENEIDVNLSNYPNGFYKVILVVDGAVSDIQILSKN